MPETRSDSLSCHEVYGFPQGLLMQWEGAMSTVGYTGSQSKPLRILVPINANADSRWGVRYAVQRHLEGVVVEVVVLNVGECITQWQVLRFRTQQEIAQFQLERAQAFIEDAGQILIGENIPFRGIFRQGDVVFSIIDVAEELECDEIVMPSKNQGVAYIFHKNVVAELAKKRHDIPIVLVDVDGNIDNRF